MLDQVTIVVADGDAAFRGGLSQLLDGNDNFRVVAEVESGRDAVAEIRRLEPDILLLDMGLPDLKGLEVLRQIGQDRNTHPIAVVDRLNVHEMTQALLLGACGAVERTGRPSALFKCLRVVLSGELWFRRDVTKALLTYVNREERPLHSGTELSDRLTVRENDVLKAVANGMPNRDIAAKLHISEYTVKHHLSRIFAKLSVSNRVELALLATKYDL